MEIGNAVIPRLEFSTGNYDSSKPTYKKDLKNGRPAGKFGFIAGLPCDLASSRMYSPLDVRIKSSFALRAMQVVWLHSGRPKLTGLCIEKIPKCLRRPSGKRVWYSPLVVFHPSLYIVSASNTDYLTFGTPAPAVHFPAQKYLKYWFAESRKNIKIIPASNSTRWSVDAIDSLQVRSTMAVECTSVDNRYIIYNLGHCAVRKYVPLGQYSVVSI
ncbi:hypothetical protein QTP88_002139 [Uroleucon formosanum]